MPYIGTSPSQGVRRVHTYTATASQTTFTGAGAEGATLSYKDSNFVDVYQNGVKLGDADYTATSGTSIVLGTGATVSDLIVIVAYDVFSAADTVSKADGGTFDGNVTMAGTLGVTGTVTAGGLTVNGDGSLNGTAVNLIFNETDTTDLNTRFRQSGALFSISTVNDSGSSPKAHLVVNNSTGDISFYEDTGSTPKFFWDASAESLGLGTSSPQAELHLYTSSSPEIRLTDTTNTVEANFFANDSVGTIGSKSNHAFAFNTNNTERMRIDSNGHVGILNTAPGNYLDGELVVGNSTKDQYINVVTGTGNAAGICFQDTTGTSIIGGLRYTHLDNALAFWANGSERMRVLAGGQFVINSTTLPVVGTEYLGVNGGSASNGVAIAGTCQHNTGIPLYMTNTSNTTNTYIARFATGSSGNTRGEIYFNGSALVYATSSDYRLKQNINYDFDATTKLKQLKPAEYRWIEHQKDDIGFLAHEVQEVFPNAVGGEKDETNADGSIKPQTYDPSKLVPLLTKALQEAMTRIETLETANTALEARITALENA